MKNQIKRLEETIEMLHIANLKLLEENKVIALNLRHTKKRLYETLKQLDEVRK